MLHFFYHHHSPLLRCDVRVYCLCCMPSFYPYLIILKNSLQFSLILFIFFIILSFFWRNEPRGGNEDEKRKLSMILRTITMKLYIFFFLHQPTSTPHHLTMILNLFLLLSLLPSFVSCLYTTTREYPQQTMGKLFFIFSKKIGGGTRGGGWRWMHKFSTMENWCHANWNISVIRWEIIIALDFFHSFHLLSLWTKEKKIHFF